LKDAFFRAAEKQLGVNEVFYGISFARWAESCSTAITTPALLYIFYPDRFVEFFSLVF
jgi:hypothetical protein